MILRLFQSLLKGGLAALKDPTVRQALEWIYAALPILGLFRS